MRTLGGGGAHTDMIHLPESLKAWGGAAFDEVLKRELERLPPGALPLQQALRVSSHALDDNVSARILAVSELPGMLCVKVGIFFTGIIAGCSCADDPTPIEAQSEYCELLLEIDLASAATTVTLAD